MNDHHEDRSAARIFGALCDPSSLRLLLHALAVGEYDLEAARRLTGEDAAQRLDHLVAVGLLVRTRTGSPAGGYRIADAAAVERLLSTVRQLAARSGDG